MRCRVQVLIRVLEFRAQRPGLWVHIHGKPKEKIGGKNDMYTELSKFGFRSQRGSGSALRV